MGKRSMLSLLSLREHEALRLILDYMKYDPLRQAPSHRVLLELLNNAMPRQPSGRPALVSKEQTYRIARRLRRLGLLITVPGRHSNMLPTAEGRRVAREWSQKHQQPVGREPIEVPPAEFRERNQPGRCRLPTVLIFIWPTT
jgi:hypothetical protein